MKDSLPIKGQESQQSRLQALCARFSSEFGVAGGAPQFAISVPLRICPLGAHSDHQGGVVTGFAIDRSVDLVGSISEATQAEVVSVVFNQRVLVDYGHITEKIPGDWGNYLRGAIGALRGSGRELKRGIRAVVDGRMPIGGLSSSAAVSVAYLKALAYAQDLVVSPAELVQLVLQIENEYLGLHNGVLDQSVILYSQRDALTVIDCKSNRVSATPIGSTDTPWEFLVVYSGLSRQLTATPFNQRVGECREAARELLGHVVGVVPSHPKLGEVPLEVYERYERRLADPLRKRARHFFTEAERVKEGIAAWSAGDAARFGRLITQSGNSSIVNYESGSPALVALYEILAEQPGVYGTRFCGGGFQGCCLALIDPRARDSALAALHERYIARHPELANCYSIHLCKTTDSGSVAELP